MAKGKDIVYSHFKLKQQKMRMRIFSLFLAYFLSWFITCLPERLFNDSTSTVLLDRKGQLLGARIADDGQWRFQESDSVPKKFETCLLEFEDRDFYSHFGVSLRGIARALKQNLIRRQRKSGGSTLTMQLVRMMRKNPPRTYSEKVLEMVMAMRIECTNSKNEILRLYASHAPFGNNVVGLEAASWRYFDRPAYKLSWSECAVLAVLPNAPGLIYPGKNQEQLLRKRNRLLHQLFEKGCFDEMTLQLALDEPLPNRPLPLPQFAPHYLEKMIKTGHKGKTITSTLSLTIQKNATRQLELHARSLAERKIYNGAVIVLDVNNGDVLAYLGNVQGLQAENANYVDCASAPRSTGSIMKPLLYMAALDRGQISPEMLLSDVPSRFGAFSPKNFSGQYEGAVEASKVLSRSLNIPMVHMLNEYGAKRFHKELKAMGLSSLHKSARHYGLSLILGGAETRLDEISGVYLKLAQQLKHQQINSLRYTLNQPEDLSSNKIQWGRGAIYNTFQSMTEVNRPDEDNNWQIFSSSRKIAWKTGTSYGFRDAWSIGVTPDYVVGVWIGNADGEGRPGLTGVKAAAPVMFDVFNQLPERQKWFDEPIADLKATLLCSESGYMAGGCCTSQKASMLPKKSEFKKVCPYHTILHLDPSGAYRVNSACENVFSMKKEKWFVLPSVMERYYKLNHPEYRVLPEFRSDCSSGDQEKPFSFVYPKNNNTIYIPLEFDGSKGRLIVELTHRHNQKKVFWHLDQMYIGETMEIHQMAIRSEPGKHSITAIDETGYAETINFNIKGKR
jgi:penicillin-binding protein 1C